jgi:hypothetical protein
LRIIIINARARPDPFDGPRRLAVLEIRRHGWTATTLMGTRFWLIKRLAGDE